MSKALAATCIGGIVKVGALPVPGTTILSEGVGQSEGILVLEEDKKTYLAKTSPDLKSTLESILDSLDDLTGALSQIATTLTSIGAGMTGPTTAPPPTLATDVANINSKVTSLTGIQSDLETLLGELR